MPSEEIYRNLEQVKRDYLEGIALHDLEIKYNTPSSTIIRILRKENIFNPILKRWTNEELLYLKNNYSKTTWDELLYNLPRWDKDDIVHKAYKIGVKREQYNWNDSDINILRDCYSKGVSINEIYDIFKGERTVGAIQTKAHKMGLTTKERWTQEEEEIIRKFYSTACMNELLKKLPNRNKTAIRNRANKMGLTSYAYNQRTWTPEMDDYIIKNWKNQSDKEMAVNLSRTFRSIKFHRQQLNLFRTVEEGKYNYLYEYIRKRNRQWKKNSAKNCEYKCIITGEKFNDIHHLYGMNLILKEAMSNIGMPLIVFDKYTQKELDAILSEFLVVQDQYPLGVCLSHDIHKKFHDTYGYGDNTPQQFKEFLEKFK